MLNISVSLPWCHFCLHATACEYIIVAMKYTCHSHSLISLILLFSPCNFKNKNHSADQTPTPTTRLIRNCEELGLFDDIKHVNPFEETFRQAIDCKTKRPSVLLTTQKSLEVIKSNDEDTLHTPHIIPYNTIADNKDDSTECVTPAQIETVKESINDKKSIVIATNESTASDPINVLVKSDDDKNDIKTIVDCKVGPTPPKIVKIVEKTKVTTNHDDVTPKIFRKIFPKPIVPVAANPIKERIRESLLKLRTVITDDSETDAKVPIATFHIPLPPQPKESVIAQKIPKIEIKPQIKRNTTTSTAGGAYHDNTAVERNREAAKRYRNKQKILHDALLQRNKQLEAENAMLKKQFHLFKKAHENCSVSLYEI